MVQGPEFPRVEGLETLESQLNMFTRLPPAATAPPRAGEPVQGASLEAEAHIERTQTWQMQVKD